MQVARTALETQIHERQRKISSLRATCASLRQRKAEAQRRLEAANTALTAPAPATASGTSSPTVTAGTHQVQPASTSTAPTGLDPPSTSDPNGKASLLHHGSPSSTSPTDDVTATAAMFSMSPQHAQHAQHMHEMELQQLHGDAPGQTALHMRAPQHLAVIPQAGLRSWQRVPNTLPPPVASFRHCAGISYKDVLDTSGEPGPYVNFSRAGLQSLVTATKARKASAARAAPGSVCWFVLSEYEVAPGLPLSYTSTMSTPECVASVAIHFLLMHFEFALCTAAYDHGAPATR